MAYTKQNFVDGEVLTANKLNHMEHGISGAYFNYAASNVPVLKLAGDISAMTKDNAVTLSYVYGDKSGTASVKWQGSSSLSYPKKNYTIKFDNAFEVVEGWGAQKKYCLKANFIDHSHARNVVSAKLWGQVVKSRAPANETLNALPNGGAIDGFPCIIELNGEFHGLYTWNIPKDGWMFGMGEGNMVTETEVLAFDAFVGYNGLNAATGEYTPTAEVTTSQTRKKNTLDGGRSYVNWDTQKMQNIGIRAYLFDANGNTSKVFAASNGNTTNPVYGQSGGDFASDCWLDVGTTASEFFNLTEPFSVPVPAGHTIRWFFGVGGETVFPDGTLTNAWSAEAEANNTWSYTWMKTGVQASMVKEVEAQEAIFCADTESNATCFRAEATLSGDFELEYATEEDNAGWALTSLNRLIRACMDSNGADLDTTIARYLDWQSAIDYYIYTCLLGGADMAGKNYLLATYDGTKWFFSAYDMDSTFGLWWNGQKFLRENNYPTVQWYASYHTLMNLILTHKKDALKARYAALRAGALSEGAIAEAFCNFVAKIPSAVLDEDVRKWPTIPSSSVSNVAQILNWYRMRVAVIDEEMEEL